VVVAMTIDEALRMCKAMDHCWIEWSRDSGEILSVTASDSNGKPTTSNWTENRGVPTITRWFDVSKVDRGVLEAQVAEIARVGRRTVQLRTWNFAESEDLIRVLEAGIYDFPMRLDFDSRVIVEHLWNVHRDEISGDLLTRLARLVGGPLLGGEASDQLRLYVAALTGDQEAIRRSFKDAGRSATYRRDILSCVVHLQLSDSSIITQLVEQIAEQTMFGVRRQAMVTLGALDGVHDERAIEVIEREIHDSSPEVSATRDAVLQRLRLQPDKWTRCPRCCYGSIHGDNGHADTCPGCHGLARVMG
jgi:hypothetical protein